MNIKNYLKENVNHEKKYSYYDFVASQKYSFLNLVILFMSFSFIGWCWEGVFHLFTEGSFVNRGVLHGPCLPIYGLVPLFIVLTCRKFSHHPGVFFFIAYAACGILEYLASLFIEIITGIRWWDYSEYFLNFKGRICAFTTFLFAVCCMLAMYVLAPVANYLINMMQTSAKKVIAIAFLSVLMIDCTFSFHFPNQGAGVTNYTVSAQNRSDADKIIHLVSSIKSDILETHIKVIFPNVK